MRPAEYCVTPCVNSCPTRSSVAKMSPKMVCVPVQKALKHGQPQVHELTVATIAAAADTDASLPVDERCKAAWDKDATIRAEFGTLAGYTAYTKGIEAGRVKVLGSVAA